MLSNPPTGSAHEQTHRAVPDRGPKYRRSTGCTDKAEAKVEANRIYREELARGTKKLNGNPIIAELFDQWLDDIDKNGYERELPLTDRAYESLAAQGFDIGPMFQRWDYRKSLRTAAKSLGLDPDDLKSLDMRDFRHAATDDGARKSGHLSGLAYMAGHTDEHTTSRYIHPQIDDAREVLNNRFPSNGTPSGTRTGGGEGSQ